MQSINYSVYDTICEINDLFTLYNKYEDNVNTALDMIIGKINNTYIYLYYNEEQLKQLIKQYPNFCAIKINDQIYAIPTYVDKKNLYPINLVSEFNEINHELAESICRDLNNILKIYDMPVEFNGIKKVTKNKVSNIKFDYKINHKKINLNNLESLINRINRFYKNDKIIDIQLDKMIDDLYSTKGYTAYDFPMTFSEYSHFVGTVLGYDLLTNKLEDN